jgi:diadenosine tetraphosphate (Ap4A) HIT family hydrolase
MASVDCFYCKKDERLSKILIEICGLDVSTLYLSREQTYRGRCVVTLNTHQTELFHLDRDTLARFSQDVAKAAAAVQQAFGPAKINYAVYGDLVPHLHYHVVPKYPGGDQWGEPFLIQPARRYPTDDEYRDIIGAIKTHLPGGPATGRA